VMVKNFDHNTIAVNSFKMTTTRLFLLAFIAWQCAFTFRAPPPVVEGYTLPVALKSKRILYAPRVLTALSNGQTPSWDGAYVNSIKFDKQKLQDFINAAKKEKEILKEQGKDDELLVGLLAIANNFFNDLQESDESLEDLKQGQTWDRAYVNSISSDPQKLQEFMIAAEKGQQILLREGKDVMPLNGLLAIADNFFQQLKTPTSDHQRVAETDFALGTPLVHNFDLNRLYARVKELFKWPGTSKPDDFMAPYFPVVQSSGMGKTKLFVELKRVAEEAVILLECTRVGGEKNLSTFFTDWFNVTFTQSDLDRKRICADLDQLVLRERQNRMNETYPIILIFDEASLLLENDGWKFRCVRWWLRDINTKNVVAIFAGTTLSLANFFVETPGTLTSRDSQTTYGGGTKLYPPFFDICSIGIFGNASVPGRFGSEYENAIPYGRPLFALMQRKKMLNSSTEMAILSRMLIERDYDKDVSSSYSILGTRVQLGHVSFNIASKVTAKGYAGLTYFSTENGDLAHNCFFPDPVCARLAMGMMIEGLRFEEGSVIVGSGPTTWMKKASDLFSDSVCRPSKSDIGEVACALYLLFCGDKI